MERKIGEIFEYNGEWYQCIVENGCENCAFNERNCYTIVDECCADRRKDNKNVIFKKLEKVGEPITVNGKNVQLLKTTIANCDNCAFYKDVNCNFTCYPRKCHGGEEGTYVEIKQTKEDMEENKLNLKPFDLQKAREGKPVYTRGGRKARIVCFDRIDARPILALVPSTDGKGEDVFDYFVSGKRIANSLESDLDLMMLPEKKEGWVNIYKERIYSTKEEAIEATYNSSTYIDTIKFSWEE